MNNRLVEQIDKQIATTTADRHAAELARNELSLELIRDPASKTLHKQIDEIETEVAGHTAKITRLQGARVEAARRDTSDEKQARARALAAAGALVKQGMQAREQLAEQIEAHITALAPLLIQWATLSATCKDNFWELARSASANIDNAAAHNALFMRITSGDGGRAPAALAKQLFDAQVGRVGIVVPPEFLEVHRVDTVLSVTEAARADTDRIVGRVDQLLAQSVQRLGVQA